MRRKINKIKKEKDKCWACGKDLNSEEIKQVKVCCSNHYSLFIRSISGETVEDLIKRKPEYKRFL